jgi:uncharacterized protein YgiM (DUF1202 family)
MRITSRLLLSLALPIASLVASFACTANSVHAAGRFPFAAAVTSDGQFRSGPGTDFYATGAAAKDQDVEVFHEDGDWSAVRPPKGSYSWVAAKHLKLPATLRFQEGVDLDSPVAVEVATANAAAFIGSELTADRDAVAVRLEAGERVWVYSGEQAGGQTWMKIAPPSGEFRWIETKLLRPTAADSAAATAGSSKAEEGLDVDKATGGDDDATLTAAEESPADAPANASPPGARGPSIKKRVAPRAAENAEDDRDTKKRPASSHPARGFWTQLQALELELSMTVARKPGEWRFEDIRRDAQNLYDGAKSDEEYDAARYLLSKLAQFESVRRERADLESRLARRDEGRAAASGVANGPSRGQASLAGPPPSVAPRGQAGTAATPPGNGDSPAPTAVAGSATEGRYDASGRLVAIPSRREGAPPYAIVDERNNVRQYVSPAPRVNLQAYVGRMVGITGVASPSPDSTRSHVVAQRIDVLDAPVRR